MVSVEDELDSRLKLESSQAKPRGVSLIKKNTPSQPAKSLNSNIGGGSFC